MAPSSKNDLENFVILQSVILLNAFEMDAVALLKQSSLGTLTKFWLLILFPLQFESQNNLNNLTSFVEHFIMSARVILRLGSEAKEN
jgi:hypothetical protein